MFFLGLGPHIASGMCISALRIRTFMQFETARRICWVMIILLVSLPLSVQAADLSIVPQIDVGAKYDSNINFNFVGRQHDFIFNTTPSVDFNYASETTKLTGHLGLDGQVYVNHSNLDIINQYYRLLGSQQVAPRLALNFKGSYTLDSTLNEEISTSGFVMNRSRRQAFDAAPGFAFNLTERATLQTTYDFNRVNYQSPRYVDYTSQTVNLGLNYLLKNAKTTVSGVYLLRFIEYPAIENFYRNMGTYLGVSHQFSEDWSASAFAGLNYNWLTSQTAVLSFGNLAAFVQLRQVKLQTFTVTPYLNFSAKRHWPKTDFVFGYTLDQSPSGSGTINQFHNGSATISRRLTERLTGSLGGNLYYSISSSPGSNYNNVILYLTPGLNYKLTEKFSLNGSYTYGWRDDLSGNRTIGPQTVSRNLVWLYLRYTNQFHYQR
jgi:hypothetical protein